MGKEGKNMGTVNLARDEALATYGKMATKYGEKEDAWQLIWEEMRRWQHITKWQQNMGKEGENTGTVNLGRDEAMWQHMGRWQQNMEKQWEHMVKEAQLRAS